MNFIERIMRKLFNCRPKGRDVGRRSMRDSATGSVFTFRMTSSFPGDVTRIENSKVEPCLIDKNAPPTAYGQPVVVDATTQGVRPLVAGDSGLDAVYGFTVRPFPIQQPTSTNFGASVPFGAGTPPTTGIIDVLRSGYIMAPLNTGAAVKGGRVFIWVAATSGAHIQGGLEVASGGGSNTIELDEKTYFNGPADANGNVEIGFNI